MPINDPEFVDILDKEYQLYGQFNVHIEFMQMGLFSQWIADWLQLHNKEIYLDDNNFSRYCCILSNWHDEHLLIKWHPYFKILTFEFYYSQQINIKSKEIKKLFKQRLSEILKVSVQTISKYKQRLVNPTDNTLLRETFKDDKGKNIFYYFIKDLEKINENGYIFNYHIKSLKKGKISMTKNYYAHNQTNIDGDNNGQSANENTGTMIQINSDKQQDYLSVLDKLLDIPPTELAQHNENIKISDVVKAVELIKEDVKQNPPSLAKENILEQVVNAEVPTINLLASLITIWSASIPELTPFLALFS